MSDRWPALPYEDWKDTQATLHMWTQIVGKIRLAQSPWVNHAWHSTLYLATRGLTTSPIPSGERVFQIDFDFVDHVVRIVTADNQLKRVDLKPQTTADFYAAVMDSLDALSLDVRIHARPNEVETAIPFAEDTEHASYDPAAVHEFWRVLLQMDRVFKAFRARFTGKCSPVHFFWGSFDLAVSRFSGRRAPEHPGGFPNMPDDVMRESYSHEVISCGFWPGGEAMPYPMCYSYAYPSPDGFSDAPVSPEAATWNADFGQFVLPYDDIRSSKSRDAVLLEFMQSAYDAAAGLAGWDTGAFKNEFR
jgi:hypothetical protein